MRRQGLTFRQWLKRRRTDATPFDKFLINIGEENDLRRYRDFIRYFHNVHQHLPAYFKDSQMYQGNFEVAMMSFTRLYDEFERQRCRGEFPTAF